jgi:hypothetical protein
VCILFVVDRVTLPVVERVIRVGDHDTRFLDLGESVCVPMLRRFLDRGESEWEPL